MAKTVDQIRQQIAKLQEQEKVLLQKEISGVVARIKEAVAHYGLTSDDIFGAGNAIATKGRATAPRASSANGRAGKRRAAEPGEKAVASDRKPVKSGNPSKGRKIAPKYRDDAGNAWTGRGNKPRWLQTALEGGKKLEDFLIDKPI